jgi:AcrR family transcriptional regulator
VPRSTSSGAPNPRQATKERLFDAFAELLRERGYDPITLAEVGERAGVSRTSVYNYFADKDALVVAWADLEGARYVSGLRAELAAIDDPIDRLRAFIASQLTYFAGRHLPPGRNLRLALSAPAYQRVVEHVAAIDGLLREVLADAAAQGYLADPDVERTLPLVNACVARSDAVDDDPEALEDSIEVTTTFVLRALGVRLGPNGRPRRVAGTRRPSGT